MHFNDLDRCRYADGPFDAENWRAPLLAVGWLEHPRPFTRGTAPEGLAARIETMCRRACDLGRFIIFAGLHICSICAAVDSHAHRGLRWSNTNLFVPGDDVVYLATGGINHYIEEHSYLPPTPFIDAVFACPDLHSTEYREALRRANGGKIPFRPRCPLMVSSLEPLHTA